MKAALCALVFASAIMPGSSAKAASWMTELRSYDQRTADIGYRLARAAMPYCASTRPTWGGSIDAIDRYAVADRDRAAAELGLTSLVQVSAVAVGSPADLAGIHPGDAILSVAGRILDPTPAPEPSETRAEQADRLIAHAGATAPLELGVFRDPRALTVELTPEKTCDVHWVLSTRMSLSTFTDGHDVDLPVGLFRFASSDDEIAFVAAHELAHVIFNQQRPAPKVLSAKRRTEQNADELAVVLMKEAHFDPHGAVNFWTKFKAKDWLGFLRSPDHPSTSKRLSGIMRVIARLDGGGEASLLAREIIDREV